MERKKIWHNATKNYKEIGAFHFGSRAIGRPENLGGEAEIKSHLKEKVLLLSLFNLGGGESSIWQC